VHPICMMLSSNSGLRGLPHTRQGMTPAHTHDGCRPKAACLPGGHPGTATREGALRYLVATRLASTRAGKSYPNHPKFLI
jgi:hypothetical protein